LTTRRSGAFIALLAIAALILPMGVLANIPGSTFEGGDGNLAVDTAGNTDWVNVTNLTSAADLATGANDNSFGQGTSENDVNIHVGTGSIPNSKADLGRFASAFQFVGGNLYLQLAWTRNNLSGTTNFDFEINQAPQPDLTTVGDKTLVRTAGDLLVTYDFLGGAQKPTLGIRTWTGSVWGPATAISAAVGEAEVNRGGSVSTASIGGGTVPAFAFGEANINLTAAGVVPANACEGFSSIFVKSRSSDSFSAALKDFIAPTPVSISNCGTVTVIKHTDPAGLDQNFSFTSTVTGTGASSPYNLNDAGTDTKTVTNVPIGSYTITEGANPAGFSFDHVTCVASGAASQSTSGKVATVGITGGGGAVTCTYVNNQNLGGIAITKTSSKGTHPGLAGAQFSITKGGVAITGSPFTSGADGTVCVDGLTFGDYSVTETVAPTGYSIDDTAAHTVTVDTNTTCAGTPETFSATDTPLSDIRVQFRDGGSGATSGVITCDNGTNGTTSTADATGWDDTTTITGIEAPTTIHCTIVIDP
jgi:Prealbumin-like fold domain